MRLLELVNNCKRIGISGHENPDGDCAGSSCGLGLYLRKVLPDAQIDIYLDPMKESLAANIPGSDTVIHEVTGKEEKYDAFFMLDSIPERAGAPEKLYREADLRINIDHHRTNQGSADAHCHIDAHASSTCEMIYDLIEKEQIDVDIARALYVGMVTDTGVFQYSSTSESTMRAAGHLISFGFDFPAVVRQVFFERTSLETKLLGTALAESQTALGGKYIYCSFDRQLLDQIGAKRKDLDSISAQLLLTQGADCSAFFHETEPGVWRASMRSNQIADVSKVASMFGGGGHTRAAGCTITTGIGEAMKTIEKELEAQLKSAGAI